VVAIVVGLLILASVEAMRTEPAAAAPSAPAAHVATESATAADRPVERRTATVERAPRPRTRVQPKSPSRPANKTSSGLFPKLRVVDDFRKP
jgi:hypothetical protein